MSIPSMLGTYPVERELGRGGMGVVYLARDPRLNRPVAIKIVPESLANNPDNMARFEREARLLAAVNHPNIASIYGVEDVNGQRLLVMEYIAGESLADRLRRGPLLVDEALDVARQIAAAVEAAHEGGIVHRDLKPGNVRVTPDGTVKVLDFGLAKGLVTSDAELAQSPTLTYSPTGLGVILGTAGYMSPEQARGKPVDRRADVWAFGCVLFECFTGKKTFEGETVSDTIARILEREPAWADLPPNTPPRVRELLRRCLEKDLKRRQRDMGDVRLEIEDIQAAKSSVSRSMDSGPVVVPPAPARRGVSVALIAAIALLAGAAAGIGIWNAVRPSASGSDRVTSSLSLNIPPSIRAVSWGFARNSDDLVIVRGVDRRPDGTEDPGSRLFARRLGSFDLTPIAGSEGTIDFARSPDGREVVVITAVSPQSTDSRLVRLPVDGSSPPFPIGEWSPEWRDMIWLADGDLLIMNVAGTKFFRMPAAGGASKPAVALDLGAIKGYPRFISELPDGAGVLLMIESWGERGYQQDIWHLDPATGKATRLIENGASPRYVASTGHLFFSRGPAVMAVRFDPATKAVIGDPVGVFDGLRINSWSNGDFSVSRAGHLLFEPGGHLGIDRRLVTLNAAHEVAPYVSDRRPYEEAIAASHDGKQVAVVIPNSRGTYEIWIAASDSSGLRRGPMFPNADATDPIWSPDDQWIAFERNNRDKDDGIYVQKVDGSSGPRAIWRPASTEESFDLLDWTHDGTAVIVGRLGAPPQQAIVVPVAAAAGQTPPTTVLIPQQPVGGGAKLSPDGRYLVFSSEESGSRELHLAEISGGAIAGRPLIITSGGGFDARWSSDSKRLYYMRPPGRIMAITIERTPALRASAPVQVHDLLALRLQTNWDILPDGRLLGVEHGVGEDPTTSFAVVLNWLDLVKPKLPK